MAFIHLSFFPGWSSETLNTVKPLSLNLLNDFTRLGFSLRQGPHQLAQKSSRTYLPRKDDKLTGLSSVSFCVKSIAIAPMAVFLAITIPSAIFFAEGSSWNFAGINF